MSAPSWSSRHTADAGDEICAAHLLFEEGRFVEAAKVFKRFPRHPIARYLLGEAYERAPEYAACRHLAPLHYFGAVEDLPDFAAFRLARCYATGLGVAKSNSLAAHWYLIAGHAGTIGGYVNASSLLWYGCGDLQQDRTSAYAYMFVAAALDDKEAYDACLRMIVQLAHDQEERGYAQALTLMGQRNLWRDLCEVETSKDGSLEERERDAWDRAIDALNRIQY